MRERLRVIFGVALVLLILVIVVSPYVDLPLTTLRARQIALQVVGLLVVCRAAVSGCAREIQFPAGRCCDAQRNSRSYLGRDLLALNRALLC